MVIGINDHFFRGIISPVIMNLPDRFKLLNQPNGFDLVTENRDSIIKYRKIPFLTRVFSLKLNHPYQVEYYKNGHYIYKGNFNGELPALKKCEKLAFERNEEIEWGRIEN